MAPIMELSEVSSIVVDLSSPPSAKTCFIAVPYSEEFDDVLKEVFTAAGALGLQPICTKLTPHAPNFVEDIWHEIRSARVVVAVVSPEKDTTKPNPNVLYEVGFAHALGKPVVMLTTDARNVPADLEKLQLEPYDPAVKNLVPTIQNAIYRKITGMVTPLTDPEVKHVTVADRKHRMLLKPEFWDSFVKILSFTKRIQENVLSLGRAVDDLCKSISRVVLTDRPSKQDFLKLNEQWKDYYRGFLSKDFVPNVADRLETDCKEVDGCFSQISGKVPENINQAMEKSLDYYRVMKDTLRQLRPLHDELATTLNSTVTCFDKAHRNLAYIQFDNLSRTATNCSTQANYLISNFVGMLS